MPLLTRYILRFVYLIATAVCLALIGLSYDESKVAKYEESVQMITPDQSDVVSPTLVKNFIKKSADCPEKVITPVTWENLVLAKAPALLPAGAPRYLRYRSILI